MGVFAVAVLGIFPLAYDNYYYNILETKYHFYCVASIAAMALMLFYGIFSGRIAGFFRGDGSEKGGSRFFKRILGGLNFVDWAMLAFWGANVISWILCVDWRWDAFWGTFGRYNGVFLITLYTALYGGLLPGDPVFPVPSVVSGSVPGDGNAGLRLRHHRLFPDGSAPL